MEYKMYYLYKLNKTLNLSQCERDASPIIKFSAYAETSNRSILALVCSNGYLLFYSTASNKKPVVRQLEWFHQTEKDIQAVCFDPSGAWLLLVSTNSFVYVLPVLSFLDSSVQQLPYWKYDDVTEIKLPGQRVKPTSIRWWQTLHGLHIAIIGTEHGKISFVNLTSGKEVDGTYIPVGIAALNLLHDDSHDTTYLLVTGTNKQQWRLLLEQKKTGIFWPLDVDMERIGEEERKELPVDKDERCQRSRPHHLSKFESGTFLTPQHGCGRNLVSAYNSTSNILQVLEGDLDQMQLFSYHIFPDCEHIVLTDKLIFVTKSDPSAKDETSTLTLLSRKFSEVNADNGKKQKEPLESSIQHFNICGKILAVYKRSFHMQECPSADNHDTGGEKETLHPMSKAGCLSSGIKKLGQLSYSSYFSSSHANEAGTSQNVPNAKEIEEEYNLDGCLIVQEDALWECRLRTSPEKLFLSLSSVPANLPEAEKLGVMLGLDVSRLYEIAADLHLANGQFAQAVHLYQLSKCPQLKRVAHFMGYGYLSELIAYIQVLFSTKSVDIAPPDKGHFANIALHCFTQQVMEKRFERPAIVQAFRKFLKENLYYDDEVAVRLLAEHGLYDLLFHCAELRGQQSLMVEILLSNDGIREAVDIVHDSFVNGDYESVLLHVNNDGYLQCITSPHLLQFLVVQPRLLSCHLQHVIRLLPNLNVDYLCRLAALYDPSGGAYRLMLRNNAIKRYPRYWSASSACLISTDPKDVLHGDEVSSNEDILKFFIFVLLMLGHKRGKRKFDIELLKYSGIRGSPLASGTAEENIKRKSPSCTSLLACGMAHSCSVRNGTLYTWGKSGSGRLGQGDTNMEYLAPSSVNLFIMLQIKVISVSCGALHTLAITDCGVFGWGSSRFGQLGVGDLQRTNHPILLENMCQLSVISVECGQYHSLFLTDDGRVYSCGWGVHGQLGHGKSDDLCIPKLIEALVDKKVIGVCAGQGHSAVLTEEGVYTFGCGMFGQLGLGTVNKQSLPHRVDLSCTIKLLSSGYFHLVAVTESNQVYTWGCNPQALRLQAQTTRRARLQVSCSMGQDAAGHNSHTTSLSSKRLTSQQSLPSQQSHLVPNLVDTSAITGSIVQVACGSHHSALITVDGEVYMWGRNMEGQLGNGTCKEQKIPSMVIPLNDRRITSLACGADFTIALDSEGKLWGWGQNDGGQLGQKPSESNTRTAVGSSGGRVITIRTNRRMITITQPCRQSILRPLEICIDTSQEQNLQDLKCSSFESGDYVHNMIYQKADSEKGCLLPQLSTLDYPMYGDYALHTTLKAFHRCCDSAALLNHCYSFGDFQAAAKLCVLECIYSKAVEYQLQALNVSGPTSPLECAAAALEVITFFTEHIDQENTEDNKHFLSHVITFWMEKHLPVYQLENFLLNNFAIFSYPLGLLLFCSETTGASSFPIYQNFLANLSTSFCIHLTMSIINHIQDGKNHVEIMDVMMEVTGTACFLHHIHTSDGLTGWNDSVPSERLWDEIFRNIQKGAISRSMIHLSGNELNAVTKPTVSDEIINLSNVKESNILDSENILFSCGHNYPSNLFKTSILPYFRDVLHKLPYSASQTRQLLLISYEMKGVSPVACPRCVITELKSEL